VGLPTTEEAIEVAEGALGRPLPDALRRRLLRNNGGDIVVRIDGEEEWWELHPVRDERNRETVRRSANDVVRAQESAREWAGFPDDAVAIAEQDGDQLVLLADEGMPKLWLHETGEIRDVEVVWEP
jgi:hypothetical protein